MCLIWALHHLRKFGQAQRPCRSTEIASHGIVGYAEPSKLKLLGVTLKLVITLHLRSVSQRPIEFELHYNVSQ